MAIMTGRYIAYAIRTNSNIIYTNSLNIPYLAASNRTVTQSTDLQPRIA